MTLGEHGAEDASVRATGVSIWRTLKDPKVVVAFIAGAASVLAAFVTQHSFVDKTACRIRTPEMITLTKLYGEYMSADVDWSSAAADHTEGVKQGYEDFKDNILEIAVGWRNKLRAGKPLVEADLLGLAKAKMEFPDNENVKKLLEIRKERDAAYFKELRDLMSTCP